MGAIVAGAARLRFADEAEARLLGPGDWLDIGSAPAPPVSGPIGNPDRVARRVLPLALPARGSCA